MLPFTFPHGSFYSLQQTHFLILRFVFCCLISDAFLFLRGSSAHFPFPVFISTYRLDFVLRRSSIFLSLPSRVLGFFYPALNQQLTNRASLPFLCRPPVAILFSSTSICLVRSLIPLDILDPPTEFPQPRKLAPSFLSRTNPLIRREERPS